MWAIAEAKVRVPREIPNGWIISGSAVNSLVRYRYTKKKDPDDRVLVSRAGAFSGFTPEWDGVSAPLPGVVLAERLEPKRAHSERAPLLLHRPMTTFSTRSRHYLAQNSPWAPPAALLLALACSDTEGPAAPPPGFDSNGDSVGGALDDPDELIDDGTSSGGGPIAPNLGGEQLCDGVDENGNGIIDDVDIGRDGLCDCIHLGFFGQVASDAGSSTGAFQAWLEERSGEFPVKNLAATDTLTAEWLSDLQVLIVGGMEPRASRGAPYFSDAELAAFDDWLQVQGNGVFTLAGYTDNANDVAPTNALLAHLGVEYRTAGIAPEGVIGDGAPPIWLTGIVAPDHPSVESVTEVGFFYGYPVEGDGTVILQSGGYDLAIAKETGSGRAFIFGDEWITQDVTWSGTTQGASDPCQQPCNEQDNICRIAEEQCANCAMQPCSDPMDTDPATCHRGCQGSCDNETARCQMFTSECEVCTGDVTEREQATPRLWLNTIRWLTPESECKVEIPPTIRVR